MPENKVFSHLAIKVMSCLAGIQDGLLKLSVLFEAKN